MQFPNKWDIRVCSEDAVQDVHLEVPYVVISITSPSSRRAKPKEHPNRRDVLFMRFHDVYGTDEQLHDITRRFLEQYNQPIVTFSDQHADTIIEFLSRHLDVGGLVVNCEAGISRSAAVAAAVHKAQGGDEKWYFETYHPNTLIYGTMSRKLAE